MNATLSFYPVITHDLMMKLGIQFSDYNFEYMDNGRRIRLKTETLPGQDHLLSQLFLKDENEVFDSAQHDLFISKEVVLPNPAYLFGPSGVAASNAEIGIGMMWTSKPSNQRGIFPGESFGADSGRQSFFITGKLRKGLIRDRFQLAVILYLKNPGTPNDDEKHLAQKSGIIFGSFGETTIHLKGTGSIFPIFTHQEDGPLWRVECNWMDPRTDAFDDENVRIIINEKHQDYKLVDSGDQTAPGPMMKEIIASALHIIIMKTLSEVSLEELERSNEFEEGSICMAVRYFRETFDLDFSSPENLAYTLRRYLDRKLGG